MLGLLLLIVPLIGRPGTPQDRDNPALLGVVAVDAERGLRLVEVIAGSAARGADLRAGDILLRLDDEFLDDPAHLDRLLAAHEPGDEVSYRFLRGRDRVHQGKLTLGQRSRLRSEGLQRRKQGQTGFEAPPWHGWAWANLKEEEEAPSRANTAGRVVVIHAFQSW